MLKLIVYLETVEISGTTKYYSYKLLMIHKRREQFNLRTDLINDKTHVTVLIVFMGYNHQM